MAESWRRWKCELYLTRGQACAHVQGHRCARTYIHTHTHTHTKESGGFVPGEKLESGHQSLQQKARSISPQGDHLSGGSLPYSPSNLSDCSGGILLPWTISLMDVQFFLRTVSPPSIEIIAMWKIFNKGAIKCCRTFTFFNAYIFYAC